MDQVSPSKPSIRDRLAAMRAKRKEKRHHHHRPPFLPHQSQVPTQPFIQNPIPKTSSPLPPQVPQPTPLPPPQVTQPLPTPSQVTQPLPTPSQVPQPTPLPPPSQPIAQPTPPVIPSTQEPPMETQTEAQDLNAQPSFRSPSQPKEERKSPSKNPQAVSAPQLGSVGSASVRSEDSRSVVSERSEESREPPTPKSSGSSSKPDSSKDDVVDSIISTIGANETRLTIGADDDDIDALLKDMGKGDQTKPLIAPPSDPEETLPAKFLEATSYGVDHPMLSHLPTSAEDISERLGGVFRDADKTNSAWASVPSSVLATASSRCSTCISSLESQLQTLLTQLTTCVASVGSLKLELPTDSPEIVRDIVGKIEPVLTQTETFLARLVKYKETSLKSLNGQVKEQLAFYRSLRGKIHQRVKTELEGVRSQVEEKEKGVMAETKESLVKVQPVLLNLLTSALSGLEGFTSELDHLKTVLKRLSSQDSTLPVLDKVHEATSQSTVLEALVKGFQEECQKDASHLLKWTALSHLIGQLKGWPSVIDPILEFLSTPTRTTLPSVGESQAKWNEARRKLAAAHAELEKEEAKDSAPKDEGNELERLLATSEAPAMSRRTILQEAIKRLTKAKTLASRQLLSGILLSKKAEFERYRTHFGEIVARLERIVPLVKRCVARHTRQKTVLGVQLQEMVTLLEESTGEELQRLRDATCKAMQTMIGTVNLSLAQTCKAADQSVINLVAYMKQIMLVGVPLTDSSFSVWNPVTLPSTPMPDSSAVTTSLRSIFDRVHLFIKECEKIQELQTTHQKESWKGLFLSIQEGLRN